MQCCIQSVIALATLVLYLQQMSAKLMSHAKELIGSKSLWRWLISTIIYLLDIIHRTVFFIKTTFRRLDSVSVLR
jgi:hypothetical protein